MKHYKLLIFFIVTNLFLFAACSSEQASDPPAPSEGQSTTQSSSNNPTTPPPPPKPITIKYYTNSAPATMELEAQLITEKFPHITVEPAFASSADKMLPIQLVTTGYIPDMISYTIGSLWDFQTTGLLSDLSDMIKEFNFNTDRFLPNVLESIQAYSDKGEVLFLPHNLSANVLYYNKDLFDKFGIDYPVDEMSWDEIYALARTMTRTEDGKPYKGFAFQHQNLTWKNQLLQPLIDPDTNKTVINDTGWKRWVETMAKFYLIPGNEQAGSFNTTFDIAMHSGPNIVVSLSQAEQEGKINWDVVSLPYFPGAQGMGTQMIAPFYAIPPTTPHRKEIFQIIDYMLSDEIQNLKGRNGLVPIVRSNFAIENFGQDLPGTEGKNLAAYFKDPVGKPFRTTPYDDIAKTYIYQHVLPAYFRDGKDINTIFREAEEKINQLVQEQLAK